ncbi:MAG: IPT/TIG domain-containing protein [Polyangiaceae bacterium]
METEKPEHVDEHDQASGTTPGHADATSSPPAEDAAASEAPSPDVDAKVETPAAAAVETPAPSDSAAEASAASESAAETPAPSDAAAAISETNEPAPAETPAPAKEPEPPHIVAIEPAHGPLRGGTRVVITGLRFADGAKVRIGDVDVDTTFESDEKLVAVTPERATFGFVDVRVTNPDDKSEVRVHGFSYDIPPLPEFVKPDTLGIRGGTARVFGEAFQEGVIVTAHGLPLPVVFKGEDCLEITVPIGHPGPVDLTITNPDGQFAELRGKLRLSEGPVIESVTPGIALPTGGTRVVVTGRNFARGCAVTLLGKLAPAVTYDSDKRLLFTAPPCDAERGAVRVTNPDGLTTVLEDAFEYRAAPPPSVTSVAPDRAWVTGGARLLVSGADFVEGCTATIGERDAPVKWKNGGLLEVMVPAASDVGSVDLLVHNPDGQRVAWPFLYERVPTPPKLIVVTPNRGPTHGNVTVVFTGDNFEETTIVRIAEVRTTTRVLSKTEMEVLVPPHIGEGPVAIELTSAEGVTVRSEEAFYYNDRPPPRVTGVSPSSGPMSGNTRVSLEGVGFTQDCWVRIGRERPKTTVIKNSETIEIVTPPCKISGFVDIEVGTNQTGSSTAKNVFRFVPLPPPVIDGVAPNKGRVEGGTEMSITGKCFNADVIVTIGGKQVKFKLISPDLIECKTPPGTDGQMVDVSVKNPDGKEAMVRRAFQYDGRYKA